MNVGRSVRRLFAKWIQKSERKHDDVASFQCEFKTDFIKIMQTLLMTLSVCSLITHATINSKLKSNSNICKTASFALRVTVECKKVLKLGLFICKLQCNTGDECSKNPMKRDFRWPFKTKLTIISLTSIDCNGKRSSEAHLTAEMTQKLNKNHKSFKCETDGDRSKLEAEIDFQSNYMNI